MCRKLVSCAVFKAILTPFSRLQVAFIVGFSVPEILCVQNSKYAMQTRNEQGVACSRLSVSEDDRKSERAKSGISCERDLGVKRRASPLSLPDPARRPRLYQSSTLTESLEQTKQGGNGDAPVTSSGLGKEGSNFWWARERKRLLAVYLLLNSLETVTPSILLDGGVTVSNNNFTSDIKWDHCEILATGKSDLQCKIKETLRSVS